VFEIIGVAQLAEEGVFEGLESSSHRSSPRYRPTCSSHRQLRRSCGRSCQRYRFEVAPSVGSLRFTNVTVDYRRCLSFLRPFTAAVRGLHLARYGAGGEDPRLSALFLGYPALIRGYDAGSFDGFTVGLRPRHPRSATDRHTAARIISLADPRTEAVMADQGRKGQHVRASCDGRGQPSSTEILPLR